MKRTEDSLRNFWENIKRTNIQIIGVAEEEKNKRDEKIWKISPTWKGKYSIKFKKRCKESHTE